MVIATPEFFQRVGTQIMNRDPDDFNEESTTWQRRYNAHFGISPMCCAILWWLLTLLGPTNLTQSLEPKHMLWALLMMKTYSTEHVLSGMCQCDEKTLRKYVWICIEVISTLAYHLVG